MTPFLYAKIPLIDYHLDNPSTGFSVEPKIIIERVVARCFACGLSADYREDNLADLH